MGKSKFNWWPFAVNMIRDHLVYEMQSTLTAQEQREHNAVCKAIEHTRTMTEGENRLKLIELVYWTGVYNLSGAADELFVSIRTAMRWRWQFTLLVGHYYGFLTEDEYKVLMTEEQKGHHYCGVYGGGQNP